MCIMALLGCAAQRQQTGHNFTISTNKGESGKFLFPQKDSEVDYSQYNDSRTLLEKLQDIINILSFNKPIEYYESFCKECRFDISISSKHKSGISQMTDFIKKFINNLKSTKTLSYGDSTIQSSIKAQIANSYIPYQHENSIYLVNNYTSESTLQERRDKVIEFVTNSRIIYILVLFC